MQMSANLDTNECAYQEERKKRNKICGNQQNHSETNSRHLTRKEDRRQSMSASLTSFKCEQIRRRNLRRIYNRCLKSNSLPQKHQQANELQSSHQWSFSAPSKASCLTKIKIHTEIDTQGNEKRSNTAISPTISCINPQFKSVNTKHHHWSRSQVLSMQFTSSQSICNVYIAILHILIPHSQSSKLSR